MGDDLLTPPLLPNRLRRTSDPRTSLEAALRAARASQPAVEAVVKVMADGVPRIDEEIWAACRAANYITSFDTVRHGRLALSLAGMLVETGNTRLTDNGAPSREWVKICWGYCQRCHAAIEKLPGPPGVFAVLRCPRCGVVAQQVVYGQEYTDFSGRGRELTQAIRIAFGEEHE